MLLNRLGDGAEDDPCLFQFILECRADRDTVKHRINRHFARCGLGICALNPCEQHLLLQGNAQFLISRQKLWVDLVQTFGLFGHAFGFGVVILILVINRRVIQHGPIRFSHLLPAFERLQAPIKHPFGLVILFRDEAHNVLVQALWGELHLNIGFPTVFIRATHRLDGFNGFAIDTFADIAVECGHGINSCFFLIGAYRPPTPSCIYSIARGAARWPCRIL